MHIFEHTKRFGKIEERFNSFLPELLYQMHWVEDMKHRDIALMLNAPRATVTRWFRRLQLPTQSCHRFTDKNLANWLYKTGKLKKKVRYKKLAREPWVNVDFFKKWSPKMAYVLGYFAADGCMFINPYGSRYVSFTSCDREILEKVKRMMNSRHKFTVKKRHNKNWKDVFTFQIGSKEMYKDLIEKGFMPKKASRFTLPKIPQHFFRHFVRGYFDGDGSIIYGYFRRKDRNNKYTPYVLTCFASANCRFLKSLSALLVKYIGTRKGYIDKEREHLSYSKLDSTALFRYMYKGVSRGQYLERKYNKFQKALRLRGAVA